jgi:hypothetical protein
MKIDWNSRKLLIPRVEVDESAFFDGCGKLGWILREGVNEAAHFGCWDKLDWVNVENAVPDPNLESCFGLNEAHSPASI